MKLLSLSASPIQTAFGGLLLMSLMVGFLCISFVHAMPAHVAMDMGSMHSHTAHTASLNNCCDTGTSDHMDLWKSTLVGIPQSFQDLLVLLVVGVATAFVFSDFFATPKLTVNVLALRYRLYAREHPNRDIYNPLTLAFAQGILNPKLY